MGRLSKLRNWPLALKLASAVFVLALVPQLVVALVNADEVRSQLETRAQDGLQRRAVEAAKRLEERVGRLRAYSELLATNPSIVEAVADRVGRPSRGSAREQRRQWIERAQGWDGRHAEIHELLVSVRQANPWFQHAYLLDANGLCVSTSERESKPDMVGRVYDYRPYFRAPMADVEPYVTDVLKNANSPGTAIFVSAPVIRDERAEAIVVIKIDTAALHDVVADLSERGGRTLLVDRFGVVVSDASAGSARGIEDPASAQFHPLASVDRYRTLFEDTRRYGDPSRENYLDRVSIPLGLDDLWQTVRSGGSGALAHASFPGSPGGATTGAMVGYAVVWAAPGEPYGYVVTAQPADEVRDPLEKLVQAAVVRSVLVAAIVAFVLAVLIRRMSRRVGRLAEATRRVTDGELGLRLDDRHGDELGELASSFDRMTQELSATVATVERQRAEAEDARAEAERAHAAKDAFIAKVGRDFRAPLDQISATTDRLRASAAIRDDASAMEAIGTIGESVEAMRHVVGRMHTLAGGDRLRSERVPLRALLEEVVDSVRPVAALGSSTLSLHIDGELGEAEVDRAKLRQILQSLVDNACKFTRHGEVRVTARREEHEGSPAMRVEVRDTGIGMTRRQIERFERAAPGDAEPGAAGMGLVISKLAAEAIGATLVVDSAPGRGSVFTMIVPAP